MPTGGSTSWHGFGNGPSNPGRITDYSISADGVLVRGFMPYWLVTEPIPNLWLKDRPLWYQPSRGEIVEFTLTHKGRLGVNGALDNADTNMFSVGTNWFTSWRSYVEPDVTSSGTNYFVALGTGSIQNIVTNRHGRSSGAKLTIEGTNYVLEFPSGKKHVYGVPFTPSGSATRYLLTAMLDGQSNSLTFQYSITNDLAKLTSISDVDSNQITFEYTNSTHFPALISKVIGPYGLTNVLTYNTNGQLIKIKDAVNLESEMQYNSSNRVAKLITPYGTNTFDYLFSTNGTWQGIRVTEHDVRKHLYLYGTGPTNILPSALVDYESLRQAVADAGLSETFTTNSLHERNSYFWGARQYANLSGTIRSNLDNGTFDLSSLTTNDYNIGRLRHWLVRPASGTNYVINTVALEREPSPNASGSVEGVITWYDYQDKVSNNRDNEGRWIMQPKFVASKVGTASSGGTTKTNWYVNYREYNAWGLPTSQRETHGELTTGTQEWRTNTYSYTGIDLICMTEDGFGISTNSYNAAHQATTNYNALGEITTYTYNGNYQLTSITAPNGLVPEYTYDGGGRLASLIERDGSGNGLRTNSYTYTNGYILTQTDSRGLAISNTWDALGRLLKVSYPDGTYISNSYDKLDIVRVLDRMGFVSGYAYDGFRQLIRRTNANGKVTTYQYCDCGSLESITDALNNTTSFTYDNAGQKTRDTFPGGSYVDFNYDRAGRLTNTTDSAGVKITNWFTVNGELYTASNAFGRMFYRREGEYGIREWYDGNGSYTNVYRVDQFINENGITNQITFDLLGRVVEIIDEVTEVVPGEESRIVQDRYGYTAGVAGATATWRESVQYVPVFSPPLRESTRLSERIEYAYDLFGRKSNEVHVDLADTAILTNRFTYNPAGDLLTLSDGKNQTTTWTYDQYGGVTNKVDATSADMFRYAYDANSRLTNRWTPAKGTTKYVYDAEGNLTSVDYTNSTDITLSYDAVNRLTNMLDAVGTTRYSYTGFGAVSAEDGSWDNDTVSYTYDNGRRRNGLSVQAPNTSPWTQSYGYDAANRLSTLSSPAGSFSYDYHAGLAGASPASLVRRISLPNGSAITNRYDSQGRMLGTWLRNNGGTLVNKHEYSLNDLDQRTQMIRTGGDYVDYTYDPLGQLKIALGKESGGTTNRWHEQFRYAYDAAGNLTNRVQNTLTNSFTLNSLNQLSGGSRAGKFTAAGTTTSPATNVTVNTSNAVRYADYTFASTNHTLSDGTNTFTAIAQDSYGRIDTNSVTVYLPASPTFIYDSNGNLTYDGTKALEYDDENQLTKITATNLWKSEFVYDGKMRRRVRREFSWQSSVWILTNEVRYIYDGNLEIQWRDANNLPTITLTRGLDLSTSFQGAGGIGGLLARTDHSVLSLNPSAAHAYYYADANGNVTVLIDTNQQVVARYLYEPFGKILSMSGPLAEANLYRFSSKEFHHSSSLVAYTYRYYDPGLQRWVNRDPLGDESSLSPKILPSLLRAEQILGGNLYFPFSNDPIDSTDPDGRILPIIVPVCIIVGGAVLCGCSKKPKPTRPEFPDCWDKLPVPMRGADKVFKKIACEQCCAENFAGPVSKPEDNDKFENCLAYCQLKAAGP